MQKCCYCLKKTVNILQQFNAEKGKFQGSTYVFLLVFWQKFATNIFTLIFQPIKSHSKKLKADRPYAFSCHCTYFHLKHILNIFCFSFRLSLVFWGLGLCQFTSQSLWCEALLQQHLCMLSSPSWSTCWAWKLRVSLGPSLLFMWELTPSIGFGGNPFSNATN